MVISAGFNNWISRYILGNRLMVGFGLISYPLYLWHWPILVFAKIVKGRLLTPTERVTTIVVSVALAFLTYRFVERPLRRSSNSRVPQGLAVAVAIAGVIGLAILNGDILSRLKNEHITKILAAGYDWEYPPVGPKTIPLKECGTSRKTVSWIPTLCSSAIPTWSNTRRELIRISGTTPQN